MAQVALPQKPICTLLGFGQLATLQALTTGLEAVTVSSVGKGGFHELKSFFIGVKGFAGMPAGAYGKTKPKSDLEWFTSFSSRMGTNQGVVADDLASFLNTQTRRSLLTSHLIVAFQNEPESLAPMAIEEDVIEKTARRYTNLMAWTESSAAAVLALQEGVSVATIHNRLRIARERGRIEKPGPGRRTLIN